MKTAIISDIHANWEAFQTCLADARNWGAERYVLLGDIVGYGPDPIAVVDLAMRMVAEGAIAVLGNHDAALGEPRNGMNGLADAAIRWTDRQLNGQQREFLKNLPLAYTENDLLFVHANAAAPAAWHYINGPLAAEQSLRCTTQGIVFCGHIHVPAIYSQAPERPVAWFDPMEDVPVPLAIFQRWLVVAGSCGQPRDGNPAACYLRFDEAAREVTFRRLPYEIQRTVAKMRAVGLPEPLAERLFIGR